MLTDGVYGAFFEIGKTGRVSARLEDIESAFVICLVEVGAERGGASAGGSGPCGLRRTGGTVPQRGLGHSDDHN